MLCLRRALACTAAFAAAAPAPTAHAGTALRAAVVQEDIAPWIGVPLAGFGGERRLALPDLLGLYPYAYWLKPSEGQLDPIRVKVLLLDQAGAQLAFVALDVVGVSKDLHDAIAAATGLGFDQLFVSATHTHSGPGAIDDSLLFEVTVTDRFHSGVYGEFLKHVKKAVLGAQSSLVDAKLSAFSFDAVDLQENRNERPGHFDPRANVLLVQSTGGKWIGAMIGFAIHGTALGDDNLSFSGDVPGAIAESFGALLGALNTPVEILPVLFINGAEGDVKPSKRDAAGMAEIAAAFTSQASAAISTALPVADGFSVRSRTVHMGTPFAYLQPWSHKFAPAAWMPGIGISLNGWLGHNVDLWSIKIGGLHFLTWPGEPTTDLGLAERSLCAATGAQQVWTMGLTNDHLGYFVTPEEFVKGGYEATTSRFGPNAGRRILKEHCQLMNAH